MHAAALHGKRRCHLNFMATPFQLRDHWFFHTRFEVDLGAVPKPGARRVDRGLKFESEIEMMNHGLRLGLQDAVASGGAKREHGLAVLVERPWLLMLAINLFLLIVGLFMEMIAALVILVPILVPLVVMAGFDPITFGLVIVMNLVIGALTPPLGVLIFTTARAGRAEQVATFRAVLPFLAAMLAVLMLVAFVPALTQVPLRWLGQ